jgi:HlyD family secretion protein
MTRLAGFLIAALASTAGQALSPSALRAETAPAAAEPSSSLPAITVSTVRTLPMKDRIRASGLVQPMEQVLVQPLIEGQPIESLEADIGDRVEQGQVLARLSDSTLKLQMSQFTASLASAEASIAQAEAQLLETQATADEAERVNRRTAQLRAQGSASQAAADTAASNAVSATARVSVAQQGLEAARAQKALVEAQIENLNLQLARTEVRAPVAGYVVARDAMVGAIASAAGSPMFTLIRDGKLELHADVSERFVLRLEPGQPATLRAVGISEPLSGVVRLVQPTIDQVTRQGQVRIAIDNASDVKMGMFVDAEILAAEREALAVPVTAIGASDGGATVMKVTDGQVARVPVTLGIREGAMVEVVSGLSEGDTVVTKAAAFVRDGDRIKPVPADAATN